MPGPIRDKDGKLTGPMSGKDKKKKNTTDGLELTVNRKEKNFQEQMQDLLSKKDKLVKQDAGDGRNKYQVAVNNLKKKIKEYNKDLKNNEPKVKFSSLLQGVKKQEREGKFDRGAEEKTKKALRKKMLGKSYGILLWLRESQNSRPTKQNVLKLKRMIYYAA